MNYIFSNFGDIRNLQEQVKKTSCYQKLFWPITAWINCSSDLKIYPNSWPSALNFQSFSQSVEQFFLTVGQKNFGNKIPCHTLLTRSNNTNWDTFRYIYLRNVLVFCLTVFTDDPKFNVPETFAFDQGLLFLVTILFTVVIR